MIELWDEKQIREKLPPTNELIIDMISYVYGLRSQGHDVVGLDLGDYKVRKFTHVFEEYNEVILDVKSTSLSVRIRYGLDGLTIEQVWFRTRMVPVEEWVTVKDL